MGVDHRDRQALGRPAEEARVLPRLVQLADAERRIGLGAWRGLDLGRRSRSDVGWAQPEPEHPEVELVVVRVEVVEVALTIDRRARRLAALQREQRARALRDAGLLEAGGHVGQRHRLAALKQRHEQERERVRLAVACDRRELRRRNAESLAPVGVHQVPMRPAYVCAVALMSASIAVRTCWPSRSLIAEPPHTHHPVAPCQSSVPGWIAHELTRPRRSLGSHRGALAAERRLQLGGADLSATTCRVLLLPLLDTCAESADAVPARFDRQLWILSRIPPWILTSIPPRGSRPDPA